VPVSLTDLAGLRVGAEDFLGAVLETAGQPIWVVDPDDVIRFANPAAIAALGYGSAEELFGRRSHDTIHYKHHDGTPYPSAACPMLLPRATGETVARDLDWFVRRDGSMFPVSYVSAPIEMPDGRGAVVASATSRTAFAPRRCCVNTMRCLRRGRARCGGSRRWWPAGRRRRRCSPPSPGRSAT
jgi:PAS domain S-box-containing protein